MDRVSTYTGLDDYDTLFAARHGRGELDPVPNIGEQTSTPYSVIPIPVAGPEFINPMERTMSIQSDQKETVKLQLTTSSSEIIGEGAAVFTDMTKTILDVLDKQVVTSPGSPQHDKKSFPKNDKEEKVHRKEPRVSIKKENYPDLFLPVRENYRISGYFHGYSDSLSAHNNPMVLVELNNLSYRYGMSIYVIDRVNGTMYGKFSIGYRMIPEKATVIPQYQHTSVEDEYAPAYENTLPGISKLPTPIAKSTPVTQASQVSVTKTERDIVRPISSEKVRAAYLENQMRDMSSVQLPSQIPSVEKESLISADLIRRIDTFCKEQNEKRQQEKESHQQILNSLEQSESKQLKPDKEEREVVYFHIAQDMEKTRDVVRRSMSRASTISAEERQMALIEREFSMIQKKMDKIDWHLSELYKNWHAEYGNANMIEECEEIRKFYKPYLDKYESKYKVLYQLLQQLRLIPTHDGASGMTPSLAALDDATSLKQREWLRCEPGEDTPRQYSSIEGQLTPHTPRSEDMKLGPTINITPEGSLADIPTVVKRMTRGQLLEGETLGMSSEMTYMDFPSTQVKTISKDPDIPKSLQGTKEASRAKVLASTRQFFAAIDQRNRNASVGDQVTSVEVHEREHIEVPDVLTTTALTTTSTTTPPEPLDVELMGTSSPRISLPEGSPSHPTVTATCRPRAWMQQLTEGQISESRREGASSSEHETSLVETLPEEIQDEYGCEWRVLHPFDLPGVRFPTDTTPANRRRLAENDALLELIQTTEYLDDVPTWGQQDYRLYPPHYGDPFYRGRGRGGRGRREWLQERQGERPNGGFARGNGHAAIERPQQQVSADRPQPVRQEDEWSIPPNIESRDDVERCQAAQMSPPAAPPPMEERLFTD